MQLIYVINICFYLAESQCAFLFSAILRKDNPFNGLIPRRMSCADVFHKDFYEDFISI